MSLPAGTRLGPYEILAPLGAGGMGEVYRARDPKLDREVAIKVLPAHLSSNADALARFEREAKAVASLSHPNILAIHDFGNQDGVAYAVMELLEGETLRSKLEDCTVSARDAVELAQQIVRGLSAAHGRGVVHRDLKPENVFVSPEGHVKILDFGLAKRIEPADSDEQTSAPTATGLTEPGTVMGTVGYMSPEQVRGLPLDHRSDIFSFGAILYELLSGKRAFQRATAADTMSAILKEDPPELSGSGRSVPPALERVMRRCVEKDRENRFHSAKDIGFALAEASGPAATAGAPIRTSAFVNRRVVLVSAIAAVLAVGIVLLLRRSAGRGGGATADVKRVAVLPFENLGAPEDEYFADGVADAIRGKLTSLPGIAVIARGSSKPYSKTTKTPDQVARELGVGYLLTGTVRWEKREGGQRVHVSPELIEVAGTGAPTSRWQQPFDAALTDVFQVQSEIASRVAHALGLELGAGEEKRLAEKPTRNLAAYDAFLKGESQLNLGLRGPNVREALRSFEQAVALDPGFALAWARVARAGAFLYAFSPQKTPELAQRTREAAEKAIALAPDLADAHSALGSYQALVLGDLRRGLDQQNKARRMAPGNSDVLFASGAAEAGLGHWETAIEHFQEAQRLDPGSLLIKQRLALALVRARRFPEARDVSDRGLALSPGNLQLVLGKVMTYIEEGDLAGARAVVQNAPAQVAPAALVAAVAVTGDGVWILTSDQRRLLERLTPSAFEDDRAIWALTLMQAFALDGDSDATRTHAEEARKALEEQLAKTPENAFARVGLGLALAHLGRKEEAVREGERASAPGPGASESGEAYIRHQRARIYLLVGQPDKALDLLESLSPPRYVLSPGRLKIDPDFDSLRGNPRFQKLVAGAR